MTTFSHVQFYQKPENVQWINELPMQERKKLVHLLHTQEVPWKPDVTKVAQYRAELGQCCNASVQLVLTKENVPLGSNITYVNGNAKVAVKADLIELLPKISPFSHSRYKHCAVVGNSGILRQSRCGQEIDLADLVVRFNLPPLMFPEDTGTKTTLMTINPSILKEKFHFLQKEWDLFVDALNPYVNAVFLIPAFTHPDNEGMAYRALYTMEAMGLGKKVFFLNPKYQRSLTDYWRGERSWSPRLSSGFIFINMALEFCQHITLYGFWPFSRDLDGQAVSYHYYDDALPSDTAHNMSTEFSHYLHLYSQKVLFFRYGKCI
ncbi:alpha-2,8-sialyltransferase 8F isoform X2 [Anolis carolinensis]|uniref:alpha-2,8-sialyltransferase 8F isoform X2 n=1 Tax=Anolis carolinensis TaxID=28377 RepID=UPI000462656B|nr:PREDICTED: alpha-2,8-sialyltransferase 8F isoform X2 [Anolis carolinensis]|eukprot:XP_008122286.1 PREDICTED: alpha-2,8-sialyltransferase 8F isoform X2 [Anolis carolinensis]